MSDEVKWTHEGWFWCCPIVACMDGGDDIVVEAKYRWLEPLFSACELLEGARILMSSLIIPDYEPSFMFRLREIE